MRRDGFTLIEVMMALAAIAIGAAGLIGLQSVTYRVNYDAREMGTATDIAQRWAERLKLDALTWTDIPGQQFANSIWLTDAPGALDTWISPTNVDIDTVSGMQRTHAFDVLGRDLAPDADGVHYCVAYRFNWVVLNESLRADLRVFWPRPNTGTVADCSAVNPIDPALFRSIAMPIVVNRTRLQ